MNLSGQKHSLILLLTDTQAQLLRWHSGALSILHVYDKTSEAIARFAGDVRIYGHLPVLIVTDLIEENFRYDTVVHVTGGDQKALLKRKMDFAFRNTPYRRGKVIERENDGRRDDKILMSAISKPESMDTWVNVLLEQKFAIQSVTSIAYILEAFVTVRKNTNESFLLIINLENGNNLRQTFFKSGRMLFSRLTTLTGRDHTQFGDDIYRETTQLRQYFERIQFLTYDAMLSIEVYAPHGESVLQLENKNNELNRIEVLDTNVLVEENTRAHARQTSPTHYFLNQVLAHRRPTNIYAPPSITRFHDIKTLGRHFAFSASMLLLLTVAINVPVVFSTREQWIEKKSADAQLGPLQTQYQSLVSNFPRLPASPREMELVVLTEEKVVTQSHSPVTAMNMVSTALASSPGLYLDSMAWSLAEKPAAAEADEYGSYPPALAPLAGLREANSILGYVLTERSQIKIIIEGEAYSPSSFREAQDKVVRFITALSINPGVTVYASRMPTDVRTDISVAALVTDGEIKAPFVLELTMDSPP